MTVYKFTNTSHAPRLIPTVAGAQILLPSGRQAEIDISDNGMKAIRELIEIGEIEAVRVVKPVPTERISA